MGRRLLVRKPIFVGEGGCIDGPHHKEKGPRHSERVLSIARGEGPRQSLLWGPPLHTQVPIGSFSLDVSLIE